MTGVKCNDKHANIKEILILAINKFSMPSTDSNDKE